MGPEPQKTTQRGQTPTRPRRSFLKERREPRTPQLPQASGHAPWARLAVRSTPPSLPCWTPQLCGPLRLPARAGSGTGQAPPASPATVSLTLGSLHAGLVPEQDGRAGPGLPPATVIPDLSSGCKSLAPAPGPVPHRGQRLAPRDPPTSTVGTLGGEAGASCPLPATPAPLPNPGLSVCRTWGCQKPCPSGSGPQEHVQD